MLRKLFILSCIFIYFKSIGQNEDDVLKFSQTDLYGSARFEGMAGSFGALGADFSAIQINPAGMGRFSSTEVALSFNTAFINTTGIYNGVSTQASTSNFKVSNAGLVLTNDISVENDGRLYSQISVGYTRLKNFDFHKVYEGQNFNSRLDVFTSIGAGIPPPEIYDLRPFTTGLAYDVYAIDFDPTTQQYYSRLTMGDMYHRQDIRTKGGIGEFHIGYSENYLNQWYYGGSIGIRTYNYEESYVHSESLLDTVGTTLRSFDYIYDQVTEGTGFNLKLGFLYLPTDQIRFGLAFESPTVTRFEDNWRANMTAEHDYGTETIDPTFVPEGRFEYRMKTPMKLRGSFAYILNFRGAINLDLEYANFPGGRLNSINPSAFDSYNFEAENEQVNEQFRGVLNSRIGFEYMFLRDVYFRAGYAYLPQPYKTEVGNVRKANQTFAGGLGYKFRKFTFDISYRLLRLYSDYYAFDPSKPENRTEFQSDLHHFVFSAKIGF
ncbi:MAG: outer membrane protein transport protein [Brumimicrobium sp.]|nr:outer membrane protein transport protein [Brumimicrobium sp.]